MSICPNLNTPEWKTLVEGVGELEAYRDFMETDGEIRTPEQVNAKIAEQNIAAPLIVPSADINKVPTPLIEATVDTVTLQDNALLNDASDNTIHPTTDTHVEALDLAQQLSETLGITYQVINAAEAQALTEQAKNPWKAGDIGFYIGDIVYFVGDHLSMENVFHEFSHPFIRHLNITNPTLINSLYSQLQGTDRGKAIIQEVKELYADSLM